MSNKDYVEIKHVVLNIWSQLSKLPHTKILITALGEHCVDVPLIEIKVKHEEFINDCVGTDDLWDLWTKTCVEFLTDCEGRDYETYVTDIFKQIKEIPSSINDDEYVVLGSESVDDKDVDKMNVSFCLFTLLNIFLVFYNEGDE